jgi:hypothetical protein
MAMRPAVAVLAASLAACAAAPSAEIYFSSATATLQSDGSTVIATASALRSGPGLFSAKEWEDHSLRARVQRDGSVAGYELRETLAYRDESVRRFRTVRIETPDGTVSPELRTLANEKDCISSRSGLACTQFTYVSVPLEESLVSALAENKSAQWKLTFEPESGDPYVATVSAAEAAGLMRRIEAFREQRR